MARAGGDADHRAQPFGIGGDQGGGQVPLGHQTVRAIKIAHHPFQKIGPLGEGGADAVPFRFGDKDGHMRQGPSPFSGLARAILAIEHARIPQILIGARQGMDARVVRHPLQMGEEGLPEGADPTLRINHLIL